MFASTRNVELAEGILSFLQIHCSDGIYFGKKLNTALMELVLNTYGSTLMKENDAFAVVSKAFGLAHIAISVLTALL
ncbi:hypothetical protein [Anaerophaga thermohalophila]|uniref:hypothetical protein n=1 Tax=Anaerophaga thermohalophila TaxID=177400 RepID=UPI000237D21F|nr:hypothetical protein [Anaerophaga thermohalophila]